MVEAAFRKHRLGDIDDVMFFICRKEQTVIHLYGLSRLKAFFPALNILECGDKLVRVASMAEIEVKFELYQLQESLEVFQQNCSISS